MSGIALGDLHDKLSLWLLGGTRVDQVSLNPPNKTTVSQYASNSLVKYPPEDILYTAENYRMVGTAKFRYELVYRFSGRTPLGDLPTKALSNVLNNLFYRAVTAPSQIDKAIRDIRTTDLGSQIVWGREADTANNSNPDWLLVINPMFEITFLAALGDTSDLEPNDPDTPVALTKLTIRTYNDPILDRTFILE